MSLTIETSNEPLRIEKLRLVETRYPLEKNSSFETSDSSFAAIEPLMFRTLQMCCHETFFDCPYYEQLMYLGDTRLQALLMYVTSGDSRLARKALQLFDWSRTHQGITVSSYPNRGRMTIAPFSLIWIAMLHDYSMWNSDQNFVKQSLPCLRSIIEYWETFRGSDNLIASPPGWNFIDWSRPEGLNTFQKDLPRWGIVEVNEQKGVKWDIGVPPAGYQNGISGVINLFYIYMLGFAIKLEQYAGEEEFAALFQRRQKSSFDAVHTNFYCSKNGLYADNREQSLFSEHSQCLALLSGLPDDTTKAAISNNFFAPLIPMAETTYYFSHYYFETCRISGRIDKLLERQKRWTQFSRLGLKTVLEEPEPSRSDCHAWSSHPLFHWYATILGVRPAEPEFKTVIIEPGLGPLAFIKAELPVNNGVIRADIEKEGNVLTGSILLPDGLAGTLHVNDEVFHIQGGHEFLF